MTAKTILIADDDLDLSNMLAMHCRRMGLEVVVTHDWKTVFALADALSPDIVCLDFKMPDVSGKTDREEKSPIAALHDIPVIIFTGLSDEHTKKLCQAWGAHYVYKSSESVPELMQLIRDLLKLPDAPVKKETEIEIAAKSPVAESIGEPAQSTKNIRRPRVLCIDDDPDITQAIGVRLRPYGVDVFEAFEGMKGFWMALSTKPDVIILDITLPDGYGNYIIGRLKSHTLLKDIPVIVLTGATSPAMNRLMTHAGAEAYLYKPLVFADLLKELHRFMVFPETPQSSHPVTAVPVG